MRKIVVPRKVSKNILIVTNAGRMRSQMKEIRALDYECTVIEHIEEAMGFLRDGKRVNVVVVDLVSATSAEKLTLWIRENRPGVRTVCVNNESETAHVPGILRSILEPANPPEIMG